MLLKGRVPNRAEGGVVDPFQVPLGVELADATENVQVRPGMTFKWM